MGQQQPNPNSVSSMTPHVNSSYPVKEEPLKADKSTMTECVLVATPKTPPDTIAVNGVAGGVAQANSVVVVSEGMGLDFNPPFWRR